MQPGSLIVRTQPARRRVTPASLSTTHDLTSIGSTGVRRLSFCAQQLAFVPIELRLQPAPPCPFDDLQSIVQQGQTLVNLPCDLTWAHREGEGTPWGSQAA